jgi:hypothetical protein
MADKVYMIIKALKSGNKFIQDFYAIIVKAWFIFFCSRTMHAI